MENQGPSEVDEYAVEPIDQLEIFDHIRGILDPEINCSLEELRVITKDSIEVDDKRSFLKVTFTPTSYSCGFAKNIGLSLRVKLLRSLPPRYKVDIRIASGTHKQEDEFNKTMNDKELVAAALDNPVVEDYINSLIAPSYV